jgi:acetate kinase
VAAFDTFFHAGMPEAASVDTTMGFPPLEGVMMAARCGSVDAGCSRPLRQVRHGRGSPMIDLC